MKYQSRGRLKDTDIKETLKSLDLIIGVPIFQELFVNYLTKPSGETLSFYKMKKP